MCGAEGGGTFNTFTTHAGLAHDITDTESLAVCVCVGRRGGGTFNTFTTHAGLAHDVTDTDS